MKQTANSIFRILLALSFISIAWSCSKEEDSITTKAKAQWEITNNAHSEYISQVKHDFELSIQEALKAQKAMFSADEIPQPIHELITEKFVDRFHLESPLKSDIATPVLSKDSIQYYMNMLADELTSIQELQDESTEVTKDSLLSQFQSAFNSYCTQISQSGEFTTEEQQCILENALFNFNIIMVTLEYSDQIQGTNLKGLFDWFGRNKKKIFCTVGTGTTIMSCANPTTAVLWCYGRIGSTTYCWSNL